MKNLQRVIAILSLGLVLPLARYGSAQAQDSDQPISILNDILVPILVIIDKLLDFWVNAISGNSLTDPWGTSLVSYLATIIQQLARFYAEFSLLLPANSV